uniref:Protein kinase domain-containing protein n=1 Tax=Ascaris lumbricoides TaxID=6252 RepID=A0A9J2P3C0_ASCLU
MRFPKIVRYVTLAIANLQLLVMSSCAMPHRQYRFLNMHTVEFAVPTDAADDLSRVEYLGGGSFGNVIKIPEYVCQDGRKACVAIKKLYEPFRDEKNAQRVFRQVLSTEVRLLQMMVHENIVKLLDLYTPDTSASSLRNVYIVSEYAGNSLGEILRRQREMGGNVCLLTAGHHKFIIYQLLRALKYIHSASVIHRDLKPGNLALTADCDLSVLDFGQARTLNTDDTALSAYVMTRWYRSPEVIYWKIDSYDTQGIETRKLILTATAAMAQYRLITELCGSPDKDLMAKLARNEAVLNVLTHLGVYQRKRFVDFFPKSFPPDLIDFLDRILVLDPEKRMTVQEALAHPYLAEYSVPEDEPVAPGPFVIKECSHPHRTLNEWKDTSVFVFPYVQSYRRADLLIAKKGN